MKKQIFIYIILSVFMFSQITWALPDNYALRPNHALNSHTVYELEAILTDEDISYKERDAIHQKEVDIPLAWLYRRGKVKPLIEDLGLAIKLNPVYAYLFADSGLGLRSPLLLRLIKELIVGGYVKAVYPDKELQWGVRGHASNYGLKKAEIHIRIHDNDNIAAVFLHELGALLGKPHTFNNMFEQDFRQWQVSGISINKNNIAKTLSNADIYPDLRLLRTRDLSYCWVVETPKQEEFEDITEDDMEKVVDDYRALEKDLLDETFDKLQQDGIIDEDDAEDIRNDLENILNEDIVRETLIAQAGEGNLDDLDEDKLSDLVARILSARFKIKYGIILSSDEIKKLIENKESLKKFLKTFKDKVIDKAKKKDKDNDDKKNQSGKKTTSIPINLFKGRAHTHPEIGSHAHYMTGFSLKRSISISFYNTRMLFKRTHAFLAGFVKNITDWLEKAKNNLDSFNPLRIEMIELNTITGANIRVPFILPNSFMASGDDEESKQPSIGGIPSLPGFGNGSEQAPDPEQFYEDMLDKAKKKEYSPFFIGEKQRDALDQIINRLTKPKQAGVFLVGEAGGGKTSLIEKLADMIINRQTQTWLDDTTKRAGKPPVRLLKLKMTAFLETGNLINMEKLNALLDNICDGRTLLFMDEAHILTQQVWAGSVDFFQYIKDRLTGGSLRIIISTTEKECQMFMSKDEAMNQRFKKVTLVSPTAEETVEILENVIPGLLNEINTEDVAIGEKISVPQKGLFNFLRTLVKLTDRFMIGFGRPRGPKDALTEALNWIRQRRGQNTRNMKNALERTVDAARKLTVLRRETSDDIDAIERRHREANKIINGISTILKLYKERHKSFKFEAEVSDVAEANSFTAGSEFLDQSEWILGIEARLKNRVHGQDHAVEAVAKQVIVDRLGVRKHDAPAGIFYLAGPTGCGKTFLPQVLAEELYPGDEKAFIRIDMTEYREEHRISNLIGSSKGYIGSDTLPELLGKVKDRPYSVVVFDEVDKAHPVIMNFFLKLFETGEYNGIDFSKVMIFFTSNENLTMKDYKKSPKDIINKIKNSITNNCTAEFLGRLKEKGKILVFNFLSKPKMVDIVQKNFLTRLKTEFHDELGIDIELEEGKDHFVQTEQFALESGQPWIMTDDGRIISYDINRSALAFSRRGQEFVIGKPATEDTDDGSKPAKLIFEEGTLSNPSMIRVIREGADISMYLVADKDAGIVCFDSQGKLLRVTGEPTDSIEIVGKKVYYHSISDGYIYSCGLDGKDRRLFSQVDELKGFKQMAAYTENNKLLLLSVIDSTNKIIALDEKGDITKTVLLEHTDAIRKKEPAVIGMLRQALLHKSCCITEAKGVIYELDLERGDIVYNEKEAAKVTKDFNIEGVKPYGLAISGNILYVADYNNNKVRAFDKDTGKEKKGFNIEGFEPYGLAISGNILYVSDWTNNKVRAFDMQEKSMNMIQLTAGRPLGFIETNDEAAPTRYLDRICVDKLGFIYIYNKKNKTIEKYNKFGKLVKESDPLGGVVTEVSDVILDERNNIYLLDRTEQSLYMLDNRMQLLAELPVDSSTRPMVKTIDLQKVPNIGNDNMRFYFAKNGSIYFYNTQLKTIYELDKEGKIANSAAEQDIGTLSLTGIVNYNKRWIVVDTRGYLFVLDQDLSVLDQIQTHSRKGDYSLSHYNGSILLTGANDFNATTFSDISISPVVEFIMEKGFSKTAGARGIEGQGKEFLTDPLSLFYAKGNIHKGDRVRIRREGNKIGFERAKKEKTPNPKAILTQIISAGEEAYSMLDKIEGAIRVAVEPGGDEFSIDSLLSMLDFKPRNLMTTDNFKSRSGYRLEGNIIKELNESIASNDPKSQSYKTINSRLKAILKDANAAKLNSTVFLRQLIAVLKLYNLNTAIKDRNEPGTFQEIESELMQNESELIGLSDDAEDEDNKNSIEEAISLLNERITAIVKQADEISGIEISIVITDKGELAINAVINKQLSLDEEEYLIDLFSFEPQQKITFDTKFSKEQDRAFAKARSEFLSLDKASSGYEIRDKKELSIWFKIELDPLILNLTEVPNLVQGGSARFLPPRPALKATKPVNAKLVEIFGKGILGTDIRSTIIDDETGILYVSDVTNQKVRAFNKDTGEEVEGFNIGGFLPYALAISGDMLYASDWNNNKVRAFDKDTGKEEKSFNIRGFLPYGLAVSDGVLYVSDVSNNKVRAFNKDTGEEVEDFDIKDFTPRTLAISGDILYVSDWINKKVRAFNKDKGEEIEDFDIKGFTPSALAISGDMLYVSESNNNKVRAFNKDTGEEIEGFGISGFTLYALAISGSRVYAADDEAFKDKKGKVISGGIRVYELEFKEDESNSSMPKSFPLAKSSSSGTQLIDYKVDSFILSAA